ncbi:MAG: hypothetical protein ABTQ27_07635 [Amaricoccus sp.]|uniref:hypothetical protein n=1 Tax=Amaricoccus sp. TaxID=1872485 RepID=UPI003314966C
MSEHEGSHRLDEPIGQAVDGMPLVVHQRQQGILIVVVPHDRVAFFDEGLNGKTRWKSAGANYWRQSHVRRHGVAGSLERSFGPETHFAQAFTRKRKH